MNTSGQRIRGDGGMVARGWRGECGANGEGCEEAEDEQPGASIINVPHEECQLLYP